MRPYRAPQEWKMSQPLNDLSSSVPTRTLLPQTVRLNVKPGEQARCRYMKGTSI